MLVKVLLSRVASATLFNTRRVARRCAGEKRNVYAGKLGWAYVLRHSTI